MEFFVSVTYLKALLEASLLLIALLRISLLLVPLLRVLLGVSIPLLRVTPVPMALVMMFVTKSENPGKPNVSSSKVKRRTHGLQCSCHALCGVIFGGLGYMQKVL